MRTDARPGREARLALLLCLAAAACKSADEYRDEADDEVYALVDAARAKLGTEWPFTIEPPPSSLRQRILAGEQTLAQPLTLVDLFEIAAENSREYQTQKEAVYLAGLDVTLERWRLSWQTSASLGAQVSGSGGDAETAVVTPSVGLSKVLGTGAQVLLGLGWSLTKNLTASAGNGWTSTVDLLDVRQPLLRGFGQRIVLEPLTQSERDLVYQARTFERFRRTFAVDVAERAYRLLAELDVIENEERNAANLERLRVRNEALVEAGRLSENDLGQARQDELRARDRVIETQQGFETRLDALKLILGLPVDAEIHLDRGELEQLETAELTELTIASEDATRVALAGRLDYMTALDEVDDSERKVYVAADALRAGLELNASIGDITSETGQPLDFDFEDVGWSIGGLLDLPLERLPERNVYRTALIARDLARRDAEGQHDTIVAQVRNELRTTEAARQSYEIQRSAVALAQQRIESTVLNLQAGRLTTRDLLEAQESLVEAENAATAALVEYTVSRLFLYRDMELLRVDENGILVEQDLPAAHEEPADPEAEPEP